LPEPSPARRRPRDRRVLVQQFRGRARIAAGDVFCGELQKFESGRHELRSAI